MLFYTICIGVHLLVCCSAPVVGAEVDENSTSLAAVAGVYIVEQIRRECRTIDPS